MWIEYTSLRKLWIADLDELWRMMDVTRVRFPDVRKVHITSSEQNDTVSITMVQKLAEETFPKMESLGMVGLEWSWEDTLPTRSGLSLAPAPYPLLEFIASGRVHSSIHPLIGRLPPFSVKLELGYVGAKVLDAVSMTCRVLEYIWFSYTDPCSAEMCRLLTSCSRLKECLGGAHVVLAEDVINGSDWTCLGLEKLGIAIQLPNHAESVDAVLRARKDLERSSGAEIAPQKEQSRLTTRQIFPINWVLARARARRERKTTGTSASHPTAGSFQTGAAQEPSQTQLGSVFRPH